MLQLHENIKTLRLAAKMTQEELARRTGYTDRSSITRIEKGEIDLPQSKIVQFAEALGTTPGHLMGWNAGPEDLGALAAQVLMDPAVLTMLQEYKGLSDTDQYMVRALVSSLAAKTKKD
jgi:transcriptional regulator with XRE-family HTH domain